jgi:catechol 2,3-dioxygenase-like lactoylglutathione lyase family enzyme
MGRGMPEARLLVNVDVPDLAAAERFYTAALGLRPGRRFGRAALELLGVEAPIYLLLKEAGTMPFEGGGEPRDYRRHWAPVHLDFAVEALEPALRRAVAAGALHEGKIHEAPWGRLAVLSDPFGHGLCLLEFNARGYDAIAEP